MDCFTPAQRSKVMSRIKSKNTAPELIVRRMLTDLGLRYRLHTGALPGKPDIANCRHKWAIFVHGCFWHGHRCRRGARPTSNKRFWNSKLSRNIERDKENQRKLRAGGWKVVVIWQCELSFPHRVAKRLAKLSSLL
jgi:DNA mismatch endonuclease (patch repair protein)